jgi:hypothetical protein
MDDHERFENYVQRNLQYVEDERTVSCVIKDAGKDFTGSFLN